MSFFFDVVDWDKLSPITKDKAILMFDKYWKIKTKGFDEAYDYLKSINSDDLENFNHAISVIKYWVRMNTKDERRSAIHFLGTRIIFSLDSAFMLALYGCYLQSLILIRDVIETNLLLEYFIYHRDKIIDWLHDGDKSKEYRANNLYEELGKIEGDNFKRRQELYQQLYSHIFSHANPNLGIFVNHQNNTRYTEATFDKNYLKFCMWELSTHAAFSSVLYLANLQPNNDPELIKTVFKLLKEMKTYLYEVENPMASFMVTK